MSLPKLHVYASIFFLLALPIASATPQVLPIINQNEFQSCVFGWCQTVAPSFLFTDINLTFANYSYISVYSNYTNSSNYSSYANRSQFCYHVDNDTERELFMNTANGSYYLASNPNGYITGFTETDPMWNGNYSSVAFLANQDQWNVNSSNYSAYCANLLGGLSCSNISYNPFTTPRTCNDTFGFNCGNQTGNGTANYYGLDDSFLGCDGTQYVSSRYVKQAYLNVSSVFFADAINATCEFVQLAGRNHSEYIWYNNDSSNANWLLLYYIIDNTASGTYNRYVVFVPNSSEGTQTVRCILNENSGGSSSAMPAGSYCANSSTNGNGWDNDDVNFTVTENDTGNITYEDCIDATQNITVNNSIYFNGLATGYFYPYSNPFNFINLTTFPTLYEANISDLQSYILASDEGDLNVNSSIYSGQCFYVNNATERTAFTSAYNSSYDSTFNATYDAKVNNPITANFNTSSYNITVYLSSASVPTCSKYYNVSTLLWCDCFNTTHKWMANTC